MDIKVTLRHTHRMSIRIGVHGDVRVSAPLGTSRTEILAFVQGHSRWIQEAQQRTLARQQQRTDFFSQLPLNTPTQKREAQERLKQIVTPLVKYHAARMGVCPSELTFKATTSRWGCCATRTRKIQFSLYLLLLPYFCIEHVVVHELAHLKIAAHNKDFYALVAQHFPQWKMARDTTRRLCMSKMEN